MIPDVVHDELTRRLRAKNLNRSKAKAICQMLGIDLDGALKTFTEIGDTGADLRELAPAGPVHEGVVRFQFQTQAESSKHRVNGRIVFVTTPYGVDGTPCHMVSQCEALVWNDREPASGWQHFPEDLLPPDLVTAACEESDALAMAKRRAGPA